MAYHRQQGVDTCIARIFNTYGPRMRPNDGRAVPTFVRQALADEPLTVFGDGSQTRSFCYVDDLVDGLCCLALSGEHVPVNIGNPAEMTLHELAETSSRSPARRARSSTRALPIDDPKVRQPDITKARRLLEWEPRISLREGLERLYAYERQWVSHSLTGLVYESPKVETVAPELAREVLGAAGRDPESAPDARFRRDEVAPSGPGSRWGASPRPRVDRSSQSRTGRRRLAAPCPAGAVLVTSRAIVSTSAPSSLGVNATEAAAATHDVLSRSMNIDLHPSTTPRHRP